MNTGFMLLVRNTFSLMLEYFMYFLKSENINNNIELAGCHWPFIKSPERDGLLV